VQLTLPLFIVYTLFKVFLTSRRTYELETSVLFSTGNIDTRYDCYINVGTGKGEVQPTTGPRKTMGGVEMCKTTLSLTSALYKGGW
jgi:hypothetical protein